MRHCVFVIGTRAQLVKVAPVLRAAGKSDLSYSTWLSGQHHDSMDDLFRDFDVPVQGGGRAHSSERATITSLLTWLPGTAMACYRHLKELRSRHGHRPLVVVHGDTLSTLVCAAAGRMAGADVVHLESGLTSHHLFEPFPEEMLRRLTFRMTQFAVCPNGSAARIMRRYHCKDVVDTGENTLLDCVRYAVSKESGLSFSPTQPSYFVASIHRFQNIFRRNRLTRIVDEIIGISRFGIVHFVVHPSTERRLHKFDLWQRLSQNSRVVMEPRMPYTRFLALMAGSRTVLSDGGSNQEELSYLGVPAILYRPHSERPEGIGRNVVFRHSIPDIVDFFESRKVDELRTEAVLSADVEPSKASVAALLRWSGGADSRPWVASGD